MSDSIEYTVLLNGRTVPTSLYKSLLAHVLIRADELEPCRPYTLRKVCGDHYWSGLGGYKTFAGMIMADLADRQLIPFLFASDRDDKPLWYRLKP